MSRSSWWSSVASTMTVDKFGRIARRVAMGLIPMESKGDDAVVVPDVEEDDDHDQRRGRYGPRGTRDGAAPPRRRASTIARTAIRTSCTAR